MRTPYRYGLHYNASEDMHWGTDYRSSDEPTRISTQYLQNPEQLPNVHALMSVDGFRACYLVNCRESTHSSILGESSYVTGAQLALISASVRVGVFEQLTLSLTHADILVRYTPNLPKYVCVLIIDKQQGDVPSAMDALTTFCAGLT